MLISINSFQQNDFSHVELWFIFTYIVKKTLLKYVHSLESMEFKNEKVVAEYNWILSVICSKPIKAF